jgi:hypothetical protein
LDIRISVFQDFGNLNVKFIYGNRDMHIPEADIVLDFFRGEPRSWKGRWMQQLFDSQGAGKNKIDFSDLFTQFCYRIAMVQRRNGRSSQGPASYRGSQMMTG